MKMAKNILELIGHTPIVRLNRVTREVKPEIWAKLELFNPTGSVKDRIALYMIEQAERKGVLKKGGVIVGPTPGNTGIALAAVAAIKGYRMIAVMSEAMSLERRRIIKAFGGEVVLTPAKEDAAGAISKAQEIVRTTPNSFMPDQFTNFDNIQAHKETTAREILEQTQGKLDVVVIAAGTGGTFSGVAEVLKKEIPEIKCVVVEPAGSAVLSGCEPGLHKIQGIGEGFIPECLKTHLCDEVVSVSDDQAISMARRLAREEGILAGISSGANVYASLQVASKMERGKILTFIPDSGQRYLTNELFANI